MSGNGDGKFNQQFQRDDKSSQRRGLDTPDRRPPRGDFSSNPALFTTPERQQDSQKHGPQFEQSQQSQRDKDLVAPFADPSHLVGLYRRRDAPLLRPGAEVPTLPFLNDINRNRELPDLLGNKLNALQNDTPLEDKRAADIAHKLVSWMHNKDSLAVQTHGRKEWKNALESEDPLYKKVVQRVKDGIQEIKDERLREAERIQRGDFNEMEL